MREFIPSLAVTTKASSPIEEGVFFPKKDNKEHLKAWRHLETKGQWPKEFWMAAGLAYDGEPEAPPHWQVQILQKMANAWIGWELKEIHYFKSDDDGHWYCVPESGLEKFDKMMKAIEAQKWESDEWHEAIGRFCNAFESIGTSPDWYKKRHPELRFG